MALLSPRYYGLMSFRNHEEAGKKLGDELLNQNIDADVVITSSREGLDVAKAVSEKLQIPLRIITSSPIPHPEHEKISIGSVSSGGTLWLEQDISEHVDAEYIQQEYIKQKERAEEKLKSYSAPVAYLKGKTAIIVEEGIDNGTELISVIGETRKSGSKKIILALPFAPVHRLQLLHNVSDQVICLETPRFISSVSACYDSRTANY